MSILIPLTGGGFAEVDPEDLPLVSRSKWMSRKKTGCNVTYVVGRIGRKNVLMHRVIMGAQPGQIIDHKDGNGLNNCRSNLRFCTISQNRANSRNRYGKNEYQGVYWAPKAGSWVAQIWVNGGSKKIGYFKNQFSAVHAYDHAARKRWGEFARTSFAPLPVVWRAP